MITFSTDNRMSNNQSSFHLVFFKVDGVPLRYTELSTEQQVEANKIYPVTFEAKQAYRKANEAVEQSRALDFALPSGHSGSSLTCAHPFCVAERETQSQ